MQSITHHKLRECVFDTDVTINGVSSNYCVKGVLTPVTLRPRCSECCELLCYGRHRRWHRDTHAVAAASYRQPLPYGHNVFFVSLRNSLLELLRRFSVPKIESTLRNLRSSAAHCVHTDASASQSDVNYELVRTYPTGTEVESTSEETVSFRLHGADHQSALTEQLLPLSDITILRRRPQQMYCTVPKSRHRQRGLESAKSTSSRAWQHKLPRCFRNLACDAVSSRSPHPNSHPAARVTEWHAATAMRGR